ncbi:NUDIX domain-containing protein [Salmonirosea aquatica]|uniref:NUDIX domain-containing protein n=1 Tax=Salmonirosea aquatica TaxID=2654236 RepID=UPI0035709C04
MRGVALREVWEETGVKAMPLGTGIFDVDVHTIPANSREAAHYHYDIRFLLEADPVQKIERNHEAKEVRWVPMEEARLYNASESILRMWRKNSPNV